MYAVALRPAFKKIRENCVYTILSDSPFASDPVSVSQPFLFSFAVNVVYQAFAVNDFLHKRWKKRKLLTQQTRR